MFYNHSTRRMAALFASGAVFALSFGPAAQVASAQCADPRGNSYCNPGGLVNMQNPTGGPVNVDNPNGGLVNTQNPTGGLVTFPTPASLPRQTTPAQSQPAQNTTGTTSASRAAANGGVMVDPPAGVAGANVTVKVSGLPANAGFVVNLAQLKTASGMAFGAKSMQTADGRSLQADRTGSFSATFIVPSVPDFIAPDASVCAIILGQGAYCAPFTLLSAGLPPENNATASSIIGHYQCSAMLQVDFGSRGCSGTEPLLVLNGDGTYSYADEQGSYSFDSSSFQISFAGGGFGNGDVLNRKLTVDSTVNGTALRYTYIRMDY